MQTRTIKLHSAVTVLSAADPVRVFQEFATLDLLSRELEKFRAVCLLDPAPLADEVWQKLAGFVESGGGVAIFLGHHAQPAAFNTETSQRVLGGKLTRVTPYSICN